MENQFAVSSTTYFEPKSSQTKGDHQVEDASLLATRLSNLAAFPMVLRAVLELGVIDIIATVGDGMWLSPSEIARRLPTKPSNPEAPMLLDRMLRFLASYAILKCQNVIIQDNVQTRKIGRVYAAEPVCNYILKDSEGSGSFAPQLMMNLSEVNIKSWKHLKGVILEGKDAFSSAHGMTLFEYIKSDEQYCKLFGRAMSESSIMVMNKVLETYDGFNDVKTLVDVGGGNGHVLSLITSKYPHILGINFDLPPVIARAPLYPGIKYVGGDMFTKIPYGDAIFMKWILHNWSDEECIKILKNCWKSLPKNGKVIVVEMVTPEEAKSGDIWSNIVFGMDMTMLTQLDSKERSLSEFQILASASGFSRCDIVCSVFHFTVIEISK